MLKVGTKALNFTLPDETGKMISLDDFKGQKVVLYFYPKDLTPGCTLQALSFKEVFEDFINQNVVIIGISKDKPSTHLKFKTKYELPFILLADESLDTIKAYEAYGEKKLYGKSYMGTIRTTYVIDENGVITYANNLVKAKSDGQNVLALLKKD